MITKNITLTEAVFLRPKMYTLSAAFGEVVCFLEGYYSGIAKSQPSCSGVIEWEAFKTFLAKHFRVEIDSVFPRIMECYSESDRAIGAVRDLFSEFQANAHQS